MGYCEHPSGSQLQVWQQYQKHVPWIESPVSVSAANPEAELTQYAEDRMATVDGQL